MGRSTREEADVRTETMTLAVGSTPRRVLLALPAGVASSGAHPTATDSAGGESGGVPVVLVFHGSNQTAASIRSFTEPGFDELAKRGAIVAYLEGYRKHWNDARVSSDFAARREGFDDVAFAIAVIEELKRRFAIDEHRVYAAGFSNGGQLVIRLIHEVPELFAAAAIVSATQPAPENFAPSRDAKLPLA